MKTKRSHSKFSSRIFISARKVRFSYDDLCKRLEETNWQRHSENKRNIEVLRTEIEQLDDEISEAIRDARKISMRLASARVLAALALSFNQTSLRLNRLSKGAETVALEPPASAELLLRYVLPQKDRSAVMGDLQEEYVELVGRHGATRANCWYWYQSLRTFFEYLGLALTKLIKFAALIKVASWVSQKLGG